MPHTGWNRKKQSIRLRDNHRTAPFAKAHPQQRSQRRLQGRKERWRVVRESYILSQVRPTKSWEGHRWLPSGKRLHNYRKSHFFHGKTQYKWSFSIAMLVYQRVTVGYNPIVQWA